ncbi:MULTISPECIES: DUF211 domain-containing protein [Acidianus]|uniref:DUF211 domain-containing protein n=3 Tax=Acidianus TaxID=12914 RepID=A0A650CSI4_ACIAM|nr:MULTISPECIES: DUF211 domain-containing protein [Acidianus]AEE94040.1 conserved hypothetical protein [Acidianus hospitalis W1]MQL55147.1 hypothetical protein [Acidianus ambivalens]PVU77338.1 hypothetical protein DDW13_00970 [Acidianus hospitalis]QGR20695.1 hypothetical protein D1866_00660 [Acidianus ambivalens]
MSIRRIVLDVLKPIKGTTIIDLAGKLTELEGIDGVNISVTDMDVETMGLMVVIEGPNINFEEVKKVLEEDGCAIHSIDEVAAGNRLVEGRKGK